jgi:hypothetical protein
MLCQDIVNNVVPGNNNVCPQKEEKKYLPIAVAALSALSALSCCAVKLSWKEPWVKKRMVWSWPAALHPVGSNVTYVINLMVFFNAEVLIIKCRFKKNKIKG